MPIREGNRQGLKVRQVIAYVGGDLGVLGLLAVN
jgi:hypothetical protein